MPTSSGVSGRKPRFARSVVEIGKERQKASSARQLWWQGFMPAPTDLSRMGQWTIQIIKRTHKAVRLERCPVGGWSNEP